jgi:protein-S-isoprenylcysteine O-methyltransferase Ste14
MRRIGKVCAERYMIYPPDRYLTDGVYRLRHPAYIGALLEIGGAGVLFLGWGGMILAFAALPFYADRIMREEKLRHASKGLRQHEHRQAA